VKIALVSEHASPLALLGGVDAGGQNVHVADLAGQLGALGHEVIVHTRRDDPALPRRVEFAPGVAVDHVDAGPAAPIPKDELLPHIPAFARDLARVWEIDRPDVVHSHFWMSGLASVRAGRALGVPVAHTYHALGVVKRRNQGSHDTSPPTRLAVERALATAVDKVISTSADEAFELTRMGAELGRIAVIPCGVDLTRFSIEGPAAPRPGGRYRVLVVSRLVERKGIGNIIVALPGLSNVELVIAGGPPGALLDVDQEAQRFAGLARRHRVHGRTELLGAVPREQVPALMRSADVVACCPWYEPFGLVAVEAMACGVPVVASAVGGLAETVVHDVTGVHVPPRDPRRIAAALAPLLRDESRRRAMGCASARRAERYGWRSIARRTADVLAEVVERHARAPVRRTA
jgi:glycosyltransferase involved in cell wall biosynthesis